MALADKVIKQEQPTIPPLHAQVSARFPHLTVVPYDQSSLAIPAVSVARAEGTCVIVCHVFVSVLHVDGSDIASAALARTGLHTQ